MDTLGRRQFYSGKVIKPTSGGCMMTELIRRLISPVQGLQVT